MKKLVIVVLLVVLAGGCGCGRKKPALLPVEFTQPGAIVPAPLLTAPMDSADWLSQLTVGEPAKVLQQQGDWLQVSPAHYNKAGWVHTNQIGDGVNPVWLTPHTGDFLREAMRFRGTPYKWGGMSRQGIDCSGLVHMAYRKAYGILTPRDACDLEDYGRRLSWKNLQPGDLIAYGDRDHPLSGGASHVAIWMGQGKILNARKDTGVVIEQEPDWLRARRRSCFRIPPRELKIGKGIWVVDVPGVSLAGQPLRASASAMGLQYVIVKAFDGDRPWNGASVKMLRSERSACKLFLYGRFRGKDPDAETRLAVEAIKKGADGFVFDVEDEYKNSSDKLERILSVVRSYRDRYRPLTLLAYSSYGLPLKHAEMPYETLERYCDIAMPQCYFGSRYLPRSQQTPWGYMLEAWQEWRDCPIPVVPTCRAYNSVSPQSIADFTVLGDKGFGVNYYKWELTGVGQLGAISGRVPTSLTTAQVQAVQNSRPKAAEKSSKDGVSAKQGAKKFDVPAMPLAPTKSGKLSGTYVVVDPGHGGQDTGMGWKGPEGVPFREPAIAYRAAWQLAGMLRAKGALVWLTAYSPAMEKEPANAQEELPAPADAVYLVPGNPWVTYHGIERRTQVANQALAKAKAEIGESAAEGRVFFVALHVDSERSGLAGAHVIRPRNGTNDFADNLGCEVKRLRLGWNHSTVSVTHRNLKLSKHQPGQPERLWVLDCNPIRYVAIFELGVPGNNSRDSWRLRFESSREKLLQAVIEAAAKARK